MYTLDKQKKVHLTLKQAKSIEMLKTWLELCTQEKVNTLDYLRDTVGGVWSVYGKYAYRHPENEYDGVERHPLPQYLLFYNISPKALLQQFDKA